MEDEFQHFQTQPPLLAGGEASPAVSDEAYFNSIHHGLSFRTLLTYSSVDSHAETRNSIMMPESFMPLFAIGDGHSALSSPYKFFSDLMPCSHPHQLPGLLSYEQLDNTSTVEPPISERRSDTESCRKQKHSKQRLGDKIRCLQKLLPCDDKMDMAMVLEEAYKYINFLQTQLSVLQSMPRESSITAAINGARSTNSGCGGDLGRLNRQQLLQAVINTPVAQTQFYSNGCCLYSTEQLILLKKNAERKALYHQMMLASSVNQNSFLS